MPTAQGTVKQVYENPTPPRTKIVLNELPHEFTSFDTVKTPMTVGDGVSFNYKEKESGGRTYYNISSTVSKTSAGPAQELASVPAGPAPVSGGRERAIIRQNALTNAVKFQSDQCNNKGGDYYKYDETDVIQTAILFEHYTSGDMNEDEISNLLATPDTDQES